MLVVDQLAFGYEVYPILNEISFTMKKGEICSLIGASGSGKTTLFKVLNGIVPLQSGFVSIDGVPLPKGSVLASCMMQEDLLLPWYSVIRNMTLTRELGKNTEDNDEMKEEARLLLHEFGMSDCESMYPEQLSGGMRQRIALGRALLQRRPLLLLDEPFGSLDVCLREQMYDLLIRVKDKYESTILLITHDFRDAMMLSDRIFFLANGQIEKQWLVPKHRHFDEELLNELRQAFQTPFSQKITKHVPDESVKALCS